MHVLKRDGRKEAVHFDKITARIKALCYGLDMNYVDPSVIALRVIKEHLYSGIRTVEVDNIAAETAVSLISQHPDYATLAARIAISNLHKETEKTFSKVMEQLYEAKNPFTQERLPIIAEKYYKIIQANADKVDSAIVYHRDFNYSYTAFKMIESNHLLKLNGKVVERPQHMLMRAAIGIHGEDIEKAIETYNFLSNQYFVHSVQTLDSACTVIQQMASSFLVTMSEDSIDGILNSLETCAHLCHCNGNIGFNVHCIRAKNTPIRGTGGVSNGLVPMLKAYNTSMGTVFRKDREGSITVYVEPWHADIYEFLELKRNTGDEQLRAKEMFYALWVPDLFMQRVYDDDVWSLMCPHECPGLIDSWGDEFKNLYTRYEKEERCRKQVKARELWILIVQMQIETGTPYIIYKDQCNGKSNHQSLGTIKCAGLSPEIVAYSSSNEIAVCNTASIAVNMFVNSTEKTFDFYKLKEVAKVITRNLDKIIDANSCPLQEASLSCYKHRAIGIGVQGLADAFILMRYPFESKNANELNIQIFETLYYGALEASCEIAAEKGPYDSYDGSPISKGILQYDMWNVNPSDLWDWDALKAKIAKHGVRNSLLIAQMSDAFMAQMLETTESIQPYTSNIYMVHALSKLFPVVNSHLLTDLVEKGLWDDDMYNKIVENGSIQDIENIPEDLKLLYKTVWEMPQKILFEMAVSRGPFVDQSQSLNVYLKDPIDKLTSIHFFAWEKGLKSSMYRLTTE
ncbi:ribonucleoside-diphosphate reductase large subunit-like [Pseudomyrmex gracilis]|uniref:ribonucleoside-diphosphate reductase large subunit-like n=1 Tax=Pseudomyrmex gracilis TaxID=219809 RepID=UPI0009957143|nr:ribonucleoside-diphosphate reductase large subunit-like [Pseudomyrmex gracilis]